MLSDLSFISSGLRRNDGSIVEGTTGSFNTTVNNQSFIRRPSINSLVNPSFRQEGDMGRYIAFNDPGQPGAGFSSYQDYLDAGNSPVTGIGGILSTKGAALGPNNPVMLPGGGSISQGEYDSLPSNPNYTTAVDPSTISSSQPINNVGIGSLTQNPISSPYLNNNQDLDQYLNSYVENLINRRMRDIFGGIMSIFQ